MLQRNLMGMYQLRKKNKTLLPSGYQQVEYLESDRTQWIFPDLGTLSENSSWYFDFQILSIHLSANSGYWGSSYSPRYIGFSSLGNQTLLTTYYGQSVKYIAINPTAHIIWFQDKLTARYSIDGVEHSLVYIPEGNNSSNTFRLFSTAGFNSGSNIRGYAFKYWDGDILTRNYVPCIRKTDSVAGMYDTVNHVFTENAGTGSFIAGPYVNAEAWTPAELSPVAWWKLEGNGFNSVGSYDASVSGAIANGGKIGQSYTFSGGTDIIEAPYTGQPAITNVFTLSAWFRTTTNSASAMRIAGLDASYITWIQDGNWWWYGGIHGDLISSENVADGQWHLATVTYSGAGVFCYLDGKYINTIAKTGDVSWSNVGIVIGNRHDLARGFTGDIDDVLIFDKALTPTEITKLYNESVYRGGAAWPA